MVFLRNPRAALLQKPSVSESCPLWTLCLENKKITTFFPEADILKAFMSSPRFRKATGQPGFFTVSNYPATHHWTFLRVKINKYIKFCICSKQTLTQLIASPQLNKERLHTHLKHHTPSHPPHFTASWIPCPVAPKANLPQKQLKLRNVDIHQLVPLSLGDKYWSLDISDLAE